MRRRRRPVFFVVLLMLFVLPVWKPEGFPKLEGWFDGALHWTSRLGLSSSTPLERATASSDADARRARDLAVMNLEQREAYFAFVDETHQRGELSDALRSLEQLPLAVAARVLRACDASSVRRSILIDRGSADGVIEGAAVVQGNVFLGTVQRVDVHSARVQLITDPPCRLAVAIRTKEGARVTSWLRGGGDENAMPLRNLRSADGVHIRPDDPVLTSNDNELVPAGLVIGKVVSAVDADADSMVEVRIRALLDLQRTTTVLVLLPPK
jgi:hypothetical protein